jgi:MarR family transcriptional regulator, organic hydroperoxide resistance regulator
MPRGSRIGTEIRQGRPFPSLSAETAVALMRTTDLVKRTIARAIEPAGITIQQYNVLRILRGAGTVGLPTLEIGARMIEQAPGVTRLVDRLEEKGLVFRERRTADRRQVFCMITPAGLRLLEELDEPVRRADREALAGLDDETMKGLLATLDRVREPLG